MHRNGFLQHRKIATTQQDPERLIDELVLYILHARRLSIKYKYLPSSIIVDVWNNMLSNTTIHWQEAKSVRLKTTGHEKYMVSVCLAAKADVTKLKRFVLFWTAKIESNSLDE